MSDDSFNFPFPSPVGGVGFPGDFIPSIVFAAAYGLLVPLMVYRVLDKRSRNALFIGSALFTIERVVLFSLRAVQAHNPEKRASKGLNAYMQSTIAMGYVSMAQDLVQFTRCVLVNATKGSRLYDSAFTPPQPGVSMATISTPTFRKSDRGALYSPLNGSEPELPDHPRQRFWFRRFSDACNLAFFAALIPGFIAGAQYGNGISDQNTAHNNTLLWYVSCGVTLLLTLILGVAVLFAGIKLRRTRRKAIVHLLILSILIAIVSIYRLCVLGQTTNSLESTAPNSQNTLASKIGFYVLHMLPEWIAAAMLFTTNVRQLFETGPWGDYQNSDETEEDRQKKAMKKAAKAAKQEARRAANNV